MPAYNTNPKIGLHIPRILSRLILAPNPDYYVLCCVLRESPRTWHMLERCEHYIQVTFCIYPGVTYWFISVLSNPGFVLRRRCALQRIVNSWKGVISMCRYTQYVVSILCTYSWPVYDLIFMFFCFYNNLDCIGLLERCVYTYVTDYKLKKMAAVT